MVGFLINYNIDLATTVCVKSVDIPQGGYDFYTLLQVVFLVRELMNSFKLS